MAAVADFGPVTDAEITTDRPSPPDSGVDWDAVPSPDVAMPTDQWEPEDQFIPTDTRTLTTDVEFPADAGAHSPDVRWDTGAPLDSGAAPSDAGMSHDSGPPSDTELPWDVGPGLIG